MAIQIGDVLGDYQITGVLGRGGMGKVFRVRSLITDREEAMKVVLPDLDEDPGLADRFLREIKVHANLQHPNIVALHTAQRIGDRLVMILELVEGVSLEDMMRSGYLELPLALHYVNQILTALAFAHGRGVIHRDIKPANILIASGGIAKLTDFGIARATGGTRLTGAGLAVGTLAYMAPEQILHGQSDARSDIYSLGLMLYELAACRRPFHGESEHAIMNAQVSLMPLEPALVNPRVPQYVSAAIMRSLAKDPAARFQSAAEFQSALTGMTQATPDATPTSTLIANPELMDLEARLSRLIGPIARPMVAEAARRGGAISEIRHALASQIANAEDREAFLRTNSSGLATGMFAPPPSAAAPTSVPAGFDAATVARLTQALAPYIGPIAKVVVANAVKKAHSAEELHNALAAEVPEADRKKFLAAIR